MTSYYGRSAVTVCGQGDDNDIISEMKAPGEVEEEDEEIGELTPNVTDKCDFRRVFEKMLSVSQICHRTHLKSLSTYSY